MFDLILMLLLGVILLFLLSSTFRTWVLAQLLGYVQRRLVDQFTQAQSRSRVESGQESGARPETKREKVGLDEIEAKKLERKEKSQYVDFEELGK